MGDVQMVQDMQAADTAKQYHRKRGSLSQRLAIVVAQMVQVMQAVVTAKPTDKMMVVT